MQEEKTMIEQPVAIRAQLPGSVHRKLRSILFASGETWIEWVQRKALEEIAAAQAAEQQHATQA